MTEDIRFQTSHHVACYLPTKTEFDTEPLIKHIWQANKTCYLPVVSFEPPCHLLFFPYQPDQTLYENRYGILEPSEPGAYSIPIYQLDIIIMPLIAFDLAGYRLGSGGGYYDRTLAGIHEKENKKPWLIGLAYSIQATDKLPIDKWDIKLDAIITEKKIINCLSNI